MGNIHGDNNSILEKKEKLAKRRLEKLRKEKEEREKLEKEKKEEKEKRDKEKEELEKAEKEKQDKERQEKLERKKKEDKKTRQKRKGMSTFLRNQLFGALVLVICSHGQFKEQGKNCEHFFGTQKHGLNLMSPFLRG